MPIKAPFLMRVDEIGVGTVSGNPMPMVTVLSFRPRRLRAGRHGKCSQGDCAKRGHHS